MMKPVILITAFFFLSIYVCDLSGQNALVISGGDSINSEYSVSYSIGQAFFSHIEQSGYQLVQGMQNPLVSITVNADYAMVSDSDNIIELFPNPVIEGMQLRLCMSELSKPWFQLIDIEGNILLSMKVFDEFTNLSMLQYDPGFYFLKVYQNDQIIKTFKVVKI